MSCLLKENFFNSGALSLVSSYPLTFPLQPFSAHVSDACLSQPAFTP